jgi:hypothetical protein
MTFRGYQHKFLVRPTESELTEGTVFGHAVFGCFGHPSAIFLFVTGTKICQSAFRLTLALGLTTPLPVPLPLATAFAVITFVRRLEFEAGIMTETADGRCGICRTIGRVFVIGGCRSIGSTGRGKDGGGMKEEWGRGWETIFLLAV